MNKGQEYTPVRRGVYILPSILTVANIVCGFFSLLCSTSGRFTASAWAILIAITFDILDGRIARLTRSTTRFGLELDSMADLISFGVAPALLMYHVGVSYSPVPESYGKMLRIVTLIYLLACTFRLAKFNTKTEDEHLSHFEGLPTPASGGILASFVIIFGLFTEELTRRSIPLIMKRVPFMFRSIPLTMIILSYLMISRVRYSNFKKMKLERRKTFRSLIFLVLIAAVIYLYPENMIFILFLIYILSGIGQALWRFYRLHRSPKEAE